MQILLIGYINITLIFIGIASSGSLWPGSCFWYYTERHKSLRIHTQRSAC